MTEDEARDLAIRMGALKPQGLLERMAAGNDAYEGRIFSDRQAVQDRLKSWTQAILQGRDPRTGKSLGF